MRRLVLASMVTLALLFGMVIAVILALMQTMDLVDLRGAVAITLAINVLMWALSPWLMDKTLGWVNKLTFLDDVTVASRYPVVHQVCHQVAGEYGFKAPRIGIIADRNPTAFTYGRARNDARIVLTEGMFEFLSPEEVRAVVAHELGHIVHRDFIVMSMASALVQVLYQVFVSATKPKKSNDKGKGAWVGFVALVFYFIAQYLVLYLSRTREFLADAFAARYAEPRHLANALVKVAYGILKAEDTDATQELLRGTRQLGLIDVNGVRPLGLVSTSGGGEGAAVPGEMAQGARAIDARAVLYDCYNPWAKLSEIGSTHPLTARRIQALGHIAHARSQEFDVDIDSVARESGVNTQAIQAKFRWELAVYLLPLVGAIAVAVLGFPSLAPGAAALTILATLGLRFPASEPQAVSVADLMGDAAASPIIGRPVRLTGSATGKANAGFIWGEDVLFKDSSGQIVLDFRSMAGRIGDLIAGGTRVPRHIGQSGEATGWFRRGMMGRVVLSHLATGAGTLTARPYVRQAIGCVIVLAATLAYALSVGMGTLYRPVTWNDVVALMRWL